VSYILEALRKLEQQQKSQRGNPVISELLNSTDVIPAQKKYPLWFSLILTALIINAGLLIWWIHPWGSKTSSAVAPRISGRYLESNVSAKSSEAGPMQSKPARKKRATDSPLTSKERGKAARISPALPEETPVTKLSPVPNAVPAPVGSSSEHRVFNFSELPLSVQHVLPEIKISLHFFTPESSSRVVRINDRTMQEGQELVPGLKLEEITPTGIVLRYQGFSFFMRAI
jgi:general secretion pathway protein B